MTTISTAIAKAALRERVTYDLGPLRTPTAYALLGTYYALCAVGRRAEAFRLLMRLHSSGQAIMLDRQIAQRIRCATVAERSGAMTGLWATYDKCVSETVAWFQSTGWTLGNLLGSRMLVVKSFRPRERGVIVVDYSYVFPLLAGLFDLSAIAEQYTLVLEPSWSGVCAPEILHFTRFDFQVFVESVEPRDAQFLKALDTNIAVVPLAANYWVDHRHVRPIPSDQRDIDVIVLAAWSHVKRHWRIFKTLAGLKQRGHRLKTVLVGYRQDKTIDEVRSEAAHYGISDQVDFYERISQRQVSALLARSKVHVLWSRRECANRAVIEALFADVPIIVRDDLTYGFRYSYVNAETGRFVREENLGDAILDMVENRAQYRPRQWALDNMTSDRAAATLNRHLSEAAQRSGDAWSEDTVRRTGALDAQQYWNPTDRDRFQADYKFLKSTFIG
jgi:glycosyltransferase involved in cell wall biosynthesis